MPSTNAATNPALDATLDVLSHSTRRYVLWYLDRESDAVSVATLASAVASWRAGDGRTDGEQTDEQTSDEESAIDPDARRRAHLSLRHVHLPRLESAGLIERTRESDGGRFESRGSESEGSESDDSAVEYVEATTDGTPVEGFFDAGLVGEFAESDRP